ncbi:uncharacterized protein IUM83_02806 [Phytophthora cinnamomi]|uniref:uncharacterized protein n=1 Tax=Phytophthora cinnamomi TaxID=4785 RepID=UPI00355A2093|nr:hypothetical protein IUM83_02806 [Phytophthora cinnamomi]
MVLYDAEFNETRPCYAGIAKVPFLDGMVVIAEAAKGEGEAGYTGVSRVCCYEEAQGPGKTRSRPGNFRPG